MSEHIVIGVHGLDSKPHPSTLMAYWAECLGTALSRQGLDGSLPMTMAYWADEIPSHIHDSKEFVEAERQRIHELIDKTRKDHHVGLGDKFSAFFKNRGVELASLLTGALTVRDNVLDKFMTEINHYRNDQYIADKIRRDLEDKLRRSWDSGKKVCLLTHSMGTFIAYDVLWRFSHSHNPEYRHYRDKSVDLFITMGSPLGESGVKELLFANHHKEGTERHYPTNITKWCNFACLGDVVSHDAELEDDFLKKMRELGLLDEYREYKKLYNGFVTVGGKDNPHKSFGYLLQPKLAKHMATFFND